MKYQWILAALLAPVVPALAAIPRPVPPLPYLDWGACPFECCTYRDWEATKKGTAFRDRAEASPAAFSFVPGEKLQALTGVVITQRHGVARLRTHLTFGYLKAASATAPQLSLPAGTTVYTLHWEGEGVSRFWYQGQAYRDEILDTGSDGSFQVLSAPLYVWWAQVRNAAGKTGWVRMDGNFANVDGCG